MKNLMFATAALMLLAMPASAETVPSTFDENCNINWVGGGCGGTSPATGGGGTNAIPAGDGCPGKDNEPTRCGNCSNDTKKSVSK